MEMTWFYEIPKCETKNQNLLFLFDLYIATHNSSRFKISTDWKFNDSDKLSHILCIEFNKYKIFSFQWSVNTHTTTA